jgi:hypothetical protein
MARVDKSKAINNAVATIRSGQFKDYSEAARHFLYCREAEATKTTCSNCGSMKRLGGKVGTHSEVRIS